MNSSVLETKISTYWVGNHDIFEVVLGLNSFIVPCFPECKGGVLSIFQKHSDCTVNLGGWGNGCVLCSNTENAEKGWGEPHPAWDERGTVRSGWIMNPQEVVHSSAYKKQQTIKLATAGTTGIKQQGRRRTGGRSKLVEPGCRQGQGCYSQIGDGSSRSRAVSALRGSDRWSWCQHT